MTVNACIWSKIWLKVPKLSPKFSTHSAKLSRKCSKRQRLQYRGTLVVSSLGSKWEKCASCSSNTSRRNWTMPWLKWSRQLRTRLRAVRFRPHSQISKFKSQRTIMENFKRINKRKKIRKFSYRKWWRPPHLMRKRWSKESINWFCRARISTWRSSR